MQLSAIRMLFLESMLPYLVFPVNPNIGSTNEAYFTGENAGLGRARYCPRFHTTAQQTLPRLSLYGYTLHSTASLCRTVLGSMVTHTENLPLSYGTVRV